MVHFILYSRSWCHLCDDMLHALRGLVGERYRVEVVDVDANPALVAQYDELVPVLQGHRAGQPAQTLCHYHLDASAVQRFLADAEDPRDGVSGH